MRRHNFFNIFLEYFGLIKFKFLRLVGKDQPMCRIEEIDTEKKRIIIQSRGMSAPIKFSFDEIITDVIIISNLSPEQASWVGYYFGMYYENTLKTKQDFHFDVTKFDFEAEDSNARYKLMLQDRLGRIIYLDRLTNLTSTRSLIGIITNSNIIRNFSSLEACYLGVLTGINLAKKDARNNTNLKSNIHLKLVR